MIFSSIEFIVFFILFIFLIKIFKNHQKLVVVTSSLFFYAYWNPIFIFLILYLCSTTYLLIKKKINLKFSILIIMFPLFYFKYSFFLFKSIPLVNLNYLSYVGELPLAISFITFTAVAILIDIRNKTFDNNLTFVNFSEFILYFPQLIAGPILRAKDLIPQLKNKIFFKKENIKFGIFLFSIGFIKKIFFADNIALLIDPIFENPDLFGSRDLIKGFLLFPLQIYFDFSGYVDMALGISAFLGIDLPINFKKPYLTSSLADFWRSWHITLSSWFRDYLYIPLGGSKVSNIRLYFNLIFTMTIAGLWHGASFNFILWGFLNGLLLTLEKIFKVKNNKNFLKIFLNCFIIFNLWLIFRITEINDLINYFYIIYFNLNEIFITENLLVFAITCIGIYSQKFENHDLIKKFSSRLNFSLLMPFFIILLITGFSISTGQSDKFIYFDF